MIRHIAMMKWTKEATPERVAAVKEGLATLPGIIGTIRSYSFGSDAGLGGNFDFAVIAEFDDAHGYKTYAEHPAHLKMIEDLIAPIRAQRAACQFEV